VVGWGFTPTVKEKGEYKMVKTQTGRGFAPVSGGGRNTLLTARKEAFTLAEGATHVGICTKTRQYAFTLAEVLITLAIIGVVATMTIPTLVADYQKKSWETSRDVFNRKLTEALRVMNVQQTIANKGDTINFVNELSKHFKITKICSNDKLQDCFNSEVVWGDEPVDMSKVKKAKHFGLEWDSDLIGVQFANGVTGLVAYNPDCTGDPYNNRFEGTGCTSILYDTSGFKSPNTNGKDVNNFGTITSLGGSTCAFEVNGKCFGAPFYPDDVSKARCEEMVASGNYGEITRCYYEDDRWAGAVEKCGGTSKMPTMDDLAALANQLYPGAGGSIGEYTYWNCPNSSSCRLDSSLGFANSTGTSEFYVWSGEEYSSGSAYFRRFGPTFTSTGNNSRRSTDLQAVCLGD